MHRVENFSICYQRAPKFPYALVVLNNHAGPPDNDNDKMSIVRARYYVFERAAAFVQILSIINCVSHR